MDIKRANEVLSRNVLHLQSAGMDYIPVKTVEIEIFEIMNESKNPENQSTAWYEKAVLIGMVTDNNETYDFKCESFMVVIHHDHHYCDFYHEAMEVIEALRVVNKWTNPYPDESFTVSF